MSASSGPGGLLTLTLSGRLDAAGTARLWGPAHDAVRAHGRAPIVLDATGVTYCDGAGVALLAGLARVSRGAGGTVTIEGLRPEFRRLLELLDPGETRPPAVPAPAFISLPVQVGEVAAGLWRDLHALVTFVGELALALGYACRHARKVRWRDALFIAENVGANALPIVALISLLTGLIMAFQAVIPMRQFGAEIYVADLVALVVLREMGPLMTAIILAGRSGSAFAAEIGTMKVNEEINALITMGLEPVRFLVVPRVLAAVMMTPLLTLFANFFGLAGGAIVFVMQGFPLITYHQEVVAIADMGDFLGGLAKSFVFGILVAGIGCLRGLQTQAGASAVGLSTTRAVVSGIILIVLADAVFSVVYYALGI
ncbi:MAG TPA: MlaE family lipid ABC transporter permease subunit [Hyphomicrobiaceae bacterium]|nr:MlaE family lipid ABC transporter permease subunit [Hyphomicrobiaceae bacterium]